MTAYHRVFSRLWVNPAFRSCSEDGRHALVYLLTCPHRNTEGLFRLPIPLAAYDLGWQADRTGTAVAELETAGFIAIDRDTDLVWLVNAVKWNAPRGPKQIKGAVNTLADVPSSPLRAWYLIRCRSVCPELADAITEHLGWSETVSEGFPYPFDSSISFSSSISTPPTPPSPQTQADPDSAGPVVGVDIWGQNRHALGQQHVPSALLADPDSVADPDSAPVPDPALAVTALADEAVQRATLDPSAIASRPTLDAVAALLDAGHPPSVVLNASSEVQAKNARDPEAYLRAILRRLATEQTRPPGEPNPLANIAPDVPVPPLPAPETTAAGLAAARAALKRASA